MALPNSQIIEAIDTAPLNRGLKGADWVSWPGNVPITYDNGDIVLFDHEADGIYQVHFLFKSRGRQAIEHAKQAFDTMFKQHACDLIFGLVPAFRRDVKLLARWVGGRSVGMRDTSNGLCELFVVPKTTWKVVTQ